MLSYKHYTHTWVSVCSATQNICMVVLHLSIPMPLKAWHTSLSCGWSMEVRTEASAIKFSLFFRCYSTEHQALFSAVSACPIHLRMICIPQPLTTSRTPTAQGQAGQVALPKARRLVKWLHLLDSGSVKIMIKKAI